MSDIWRGILAIFRNHLNPEFVCCSQGILIRRHGYIGSWREKHSR
jgi:hypothetical protein